MREGASERARLGARREEALDDLLRRQRRVSALGREEEGGGLSGFETHLARVVHARPAPLEQVVRVRL